MTSILDFNSDEKYESILEWTYDEANSHANLSPIHIRHLLELDQEIAFFFFSKSQEHREIYAPRDSYQDAIDPLSRVFADFKG